MDKISRRLFLQKAILAGSAIAASPTFLLKNAGAESNEKIITHPRIDNTRVVGITDNAMTKALDPVSTWARQEELVVSEKVWENMDRLASGLTEMKDPVKAWQTVFIQPPQKTWAETVVAIKTNHIAQQHTRSAVITKVCHTLTDVIGVKPSNTHIYDACHGRNLSRDTPFYGLPEGCQIENNWGGSTARTAIPKPWKDGRSASRCLRYLVDGTVDILINISMCKGHGNHFGGFTMTMKNHFGTFDPGPGHQGGSDDYLIAINKTPEILGLQDERTGKVLFPRQQLCIVDALWASKPGPSGLPTHQPNFLAMGVLSPVVDYQLATQFRGKKLGWSYNQGMARRFLTEFGYTERDLPEGGRLIEV
ncbi:MAG: DUF362 domain-containing protein [Deltaproteobacteria bacterium]|nr:DUF362 domain-containing protein [Deltaproteobacteria bacterium]